MLSKILKLEAVQQLNKQEQKTINGGAIPTCLRNCFQDFVDCREDGHAHCSASLAVCRSLC